MLEESLLEFTEESCLDSFDAVLFTQVLVIEIQFALSVRSSKIVGADVLAISVPFICLFGPWIKKFNLGLLVGNERGVVFQLVNIMKHFFVAVFFAEGPLVPHRVRIRKDLAGLECHHLLLNSFFQNFVNRNLRDFLLVSRVRLKI